MIRSNGVTPGKQRKAALERGKAHHERDPIEEWLKRARGVAKRKTTTAKIVKLTRGD
jgi:hypothetical protein